MIPRLTELQGVSETYQEFLRELSARGFTGDCHPDYATRLVTATDNSVYQILPQAVVYPRSHDDVVILAKLAAEPQFRAVTMTPRGGGTGTNGQSLSDGIIVDVSRHMNAILDVDLHAGVAVVQPGVVLDQLNQHLKPHGVFFAPNLSPSSRATIGGMISTDACGKGSRIHGRTSEHVASLDAVLLGGETLTTRALDDTELSDAQDGDTVSAGVHRICDEVATTHADLIVEQFPKLQRFMTGYNLARIRHEGQFSLTWLLAGSEGTLAFLTQATLRLTPLPTHSQLVVVKYSSFEAALGAAEVIVESNPGAIETIDDTVLGLARQDVIWHAVGSLLEDPPGSPRTAAINLIEYEGTDGEAVQERAIALLESYEPGRAVCARDTEETAALWALRKKGVGLLGNSRGPRRPVAFVEDTVVPPANLRPYIREFRAILDEAGVEYGMFGHIDVGCLHVRPALNLLDPDDERLLRRISDQVVDLVQRYGGQIWGEHGKGMRSEYNPRFFGDELYRQLCRIKAAFDPHNQLNPGKLAVPEGFNAELVTVDAPKRGALDRQIAPEVRAAFETVVTCNGNGACFDVNPDSVMCPSSKITRSRIHSPKGRAGVMRDWLRQLSAAGVTPANVQSGGLLERARNSRAGDYDYSHEVYNAMDGCLGCKACATQCPIRVDVPAFRSDFLALYHTRYLRPLRDYMVGMLERSVAWMAALPRLSNAVTQSPPGRWVLKKIGLVDTPKLSVHTARAGLRSRGIPRFDAARVRALDEATRARAVLLLPDAFTTFYESEVLLAAVDLLTALDFHVEVLPYNQSGKGWHVKGFLDRYRRVASDRAAELDALAELNLPVVGLDPAVTLVYRDELVHALKRRANVEVLLIQEFLATRVSATLKNTVTEPLHHFGHCTERTGQPESDSLWAQVFTALGVPHQIHKTGCCGMCGVFGHEARHLEESRGVCDLSWDHQLEGLEPTHVMATGHSCRHQVHRFRGFRPRHPVEVLAELTRR